MPVDPPVSEAAVHSTGGAWPLLPEPDADLARASATRRTRGRFPGRHLSRPDGRSCPTSATVFPGHTPEVEKSVEPLSRAQALIELAKDTYQFDVQGPAAIDVLGAVVRPATCYRLSTGDLDAPSGR